MKEYLSKLLPSVLLNELINDIDIDRLTEIRMRLNKPIYYALNGRYKKLKNDYIVQASDIEYVLAVATKSSLYAHNTDILQGYITYEAGIRIGVCGQGITKNNQIIAIKNITSLCIRLPHFVEFDDKRIDKLIENFDNTLIISKPGYGKTTLLRYMIKRLSDMAYNVLVLDERGELSCGNSQYIQLGECSDIVLDVPKLIAYANQVRSMRPDIIASDEIFGTKEMDCILDCIRCGSRIIATIHSSDLQKLKSSEYSRLLKNIRYVVEIKGIGYIERVSDISNV